MDNRKPGTRERKIEFDVPGKVGMPRAVLGSFPPKFQTCSRNTSNLSHPVYSRNAVDIIDNGLEACSTPQTPLLPVGFPKINCGN